MQTDTLHEQQTAAVIAENPVDIIITRVPRSDDGAGGYVDGSPVVLKPQTVRIVGSSRVGASITRMTSDGQVAVVDATLLGMPDLNIERDDRFESSGTKYQVVTVNRTPRWRVSAELVTRG